MQHILRVENFKSMNAAASRNWLFMAPVWRKSGTSELVEKPYQFLQVHIDFLGRFSSERQCYYVWRVEPSQQLNTQISHLLTSPTPAGHGRESEVKMRENSLVDIKTISEREGGGGESNIKSVITTTHKQPDNPASQWVATLKRLCNLFFLSKHGIMWHGISLWAVWLPWLWHLPASYPPARIGAGGWEDLCYQHHCCHEPKIRHRMGLLLGWS